MKRFFAFIIRQSVAIALVVIFVLAFGVYSTVKMPINLLPDINVPMVCVQVIYPGANAPSVEKDVTEKLEDGLSAIGGVTSVNSYSYDNLSALVLSFDYGTDTKSKQSEINDKLRSMDLPDGVSSDVYDIDLNAEALAVLSVTSSKADPAAEEYSHLTEAEAKEEAQKANLEYAYEAASELSTRLSAIDGVESVEIKGGPENVYTVSPFGGFELISPLLVQAFSYGALDLPLGNITESGKDVQIRNNSDIASEEDILKTPVTLPVEFCKVLNSIREQISAGLKASLFHYDIDDPATAESVVANPLIFNYIVNTVKASLDTVSEEAVKFIILNKFAEYEENAEGERVANVKELVTTVGEVASCVVVPHYSSYAYYYDSGKVSFTPGIVIEIYKSNGANAAAVVDNVKSVYGDYTKNGAADLGAEIKLLDDQSQFISDSISNVLVSMLIGGLLAVLVIFVFLKKVRTSLIIAVTMPLSVLAAMICLSLMGITLNMVSLGGLAVGIGMLVDNSIVVIESITKHREMDKSAFDAAVDGTTEVGGALFGSTLTTVSVFIPIIFSGGLTGEIFTDLSWAVIFSLSLSLIVAVTVIPALYALTSRGGRMLKGGRFKKTLSKPDTVLAEVRAPELTAPAETLTEQAEECGYNDGLSAQPDAATEELPENIATEQTPENIVTDETAGQGLETGENHVMTESAEPMQKSKEAKPKKSFRERLSALKEPRIMNAVTGFYSRLLPKVLKRKIVPILSAVAIFGASIGLLFLTGTEFLPSIDKGQIEVNMAYGSSEELGTIESDVFAFADKIGQNIENIDYISVSVGKNGLLALTDTGIITVQLTTSRGTEEVVSRIRKLAAEDSDSAKGRSVTVRQIDGVVASLMSGSDDLSVTILGENSQTLLEIAGKIETELAARNFTDIKNSATETSTQYILRFDKKALAQKGIDYQTLILTLRIGIASYTACTVNIEGSERELAVKFADGVISDAEDLKNFIVGYADGAPVKLADVLLPDENGNVLAPEEVESCIRRSDGKQMISVSAAKEGVDTGSAGREMQSVAAEVLKEYNGYKFEQSGISSYLNDAFSGLVVALVISFFLLYAVMAVQFGSALTPLIIMASIPFSFTGGFIALVITRTSLNVVSFIGLIMLMGVIVNNAIVMIEKIKQLHAEGMPHFNAVQEACKVRLRPIFMTTLTTILALIPLAIGLGSGSELMQPLGIVVIGGLLIGTLVTLILVPAVYCAVYRLSEKFPNGKNKREPE